MFKKFFTIAAAAVVVAGCGKETVSVKDGASQLKPIAFTSYTQGEVKADVTGDDLTSISVLANHTPQGGAASKYFKETISISSSKGTSSAYWPSSGTMDFYASNKEVSETGVVTVTAVTEDVVIAKNTNITCLSTSDVSLAFSHIFAKLAVTAKVKDATALKATISKIEVVAKAPASYDITKDSGNWTLSSGEASTETYLSTSTEIAEATATNITLSKEYVAPQDGVSIKVYYKVTNAAGTTTYVDKTSGPAEITGLNFAAGAKHTLNLTFDATKISFSTSVNAFTDGTSTDKTL